MGKNSKQKLKEAILAQLGGTGTAISARKGFNELHRRGMIRDPELLNWPVAPDDLLVPAGITAGNEFFNFLGEKIETLKDLRKHSLTATLSSYSLWKTFELSLLALNHLDNFNKLLPINFAPKFPYGIVKDLVTVSVTSLALNYDSIKSKAKGPESVGVTGKITTEENHKKIEVPYDSREAYQAVEISSKCYWKDKKRGMELHLAERDTGEPIEAILKKDLELEEDGRIEAAAPKDLSKYSKTLEPCEELEGAKWIKLAYEKSEEIEEIDETFSWPKTRWIPFYKIENLEERLKGEKEFSFYS